MGVAIITRGFLERKRKCAAGFGSKVTYAYDSKGRLARQTIDGSPIDYEYTKYGQLAGKHLGGMLNPDASVTYEYSKSGRIVARTANGVRQTYEYDKKGQLLAVKDSDGNAVERYAYDKAGNMLKKKVNSITTTFTFDEANQLISSTADGVTTRYTYDAAGRMIREGDKTYRYGYLDKVMSVTENDKTYTYPYHPDGQLATANYGANPESFTWDGLALIQRGDEQFINEPNVGSGNPVASSKGNAYFNDALGTTVGSKSNGKYSIAALTAFGEDSTIRSPTPISNANFFTGKPYIEGLGHTFLMRNYRACLAKWQTADPMGYPDGWNQQRYGHNTPNTGIDLYGGIWGNLEFLAYYFNQDSTRPYALDTDVMGLTDAIYQNIVNQLNESLCDYIDKIAREKITSDASGTFEFSVNRPDGVACENICFSLGGGSVRFNMSVDGGWEPYAQDCDDLVYYYWSAHGICRYSDIFQDALDVFNLIKEDTYIDLGTFYLGVVGETGVGITIPGISDFPFGRPFAYSHEWNYKISSDGIVNRPE